MAWATLGFFVAQLVIRVSYDVLLTRRLAQMKVHLSFLLDERRLKAYLHGTTLSHATNLQQAYDMT